MRLSLFPLTYIVPGLVATLLPVSMAQAATLISTGSVDSSRTNFKKNASITKFDSSLGDLTSILVELKGKVTGSIRLESEDAEEATVTADLASEIKLKRPDMSDLVVTLPKASIAKDLSASDDVFDFGGTSGFTVNDLAEEQTASILLTDPSDLSLFLGSGNLLLPVVATGKSSATGSGNLTSRFATLAAANVSVTYKYTPATPVPEPGITLGLLAVGGGMMAKRKLDNKA